MFGADLMGFDCVRWAVLNARDVTSHVINLWVTVNIL